MTRLYEEGRGEAGSDIPDSLVLQWWLGWSDWLSRSALSPSLLASPSPPCPSYVSFLNLQAQWSGTSYMTWPRPQTGSSGPHVRTSRDAQLDSDGGQWDSVTTQIVISRLPDHWLGHPSMRAAKKKWWNLVLLASVICQINVSYGDHPLSWRSLSLTSGQVISSGGSQLLPSPLSCFSQVSFWHIRGRCGVGRVFHLLLGQSHNILTQLLEIQALSLLFLCCFVRAITFCSLSTLSAFAFWMHFWIHICQNNFHNEKAIKTYKSTRGAQPKVLQLVSVLWFGEYSFILLQSQKSNFTRGVACEMMGFWEIIQFGFMSLF